MKRIILAIAAAAAVLTGSVAAAAPAFASSGPATAKAVVHAADHPDTTSVCNTGVIRSDCVWAHDNLSRQFIATNNGDGTWTVNITDNGSFAGFADPSTGAALVSSGPVKGTYQVTVTSASTPSSANLPATMDGDVSTTAMMQAFFGDPSAQVVGGAYTFSYQNGSYVQSSAAPYITGSIRGH